MNIINISNCPYCNKNHYDIREQRFNIPMPMGCAWSICPITFKVIYAKGVGLYKTVEEIMKGYCIGVD